MIRAVLFDLYETLVTEAGVPKEPKDAWAARLGLPPDAFRAAWAASHTVRMTGGDADFAATLRRIGQALGSAPDQRAIAALSAERLALKTLPFATIDARVRDLLRALRGRDLQIAVVSNCAPEEVAAWPACALAPLADICVWSYALGVAKPAPAIYERALQLLGVAPGDAIFVGDGGSDELAGARRVEIAAYQAAWFARARGRRITADPAALAVLEAPDDVLTVAAAVGRSHQRRMPDAP